MAKLTPEQLADVVQKAGFTKEHKSRGARDDAVAVAVALCESSGDTDAVGDGGDSLGLFQIHQPTWSGKFMYRGSEWFDAHNNAAAAHAIYRAAGRSFTDWTCYKSGGYLRHLSKAQKAVGDPQSSPEIRNPDSIAQQGVDKAVGLVPGLSELIALVNFITNEDNWKRLAMFVGGGALIVIGLIATGVPQKAASALPAGRALKAAKAGKRVRAATEAASAASAVKGGNGS